MVSRLRSVLGQRGSRPTPPADFHFDLHHVPWHTDPGVVERRWANRVSFDAEDDSLPRADARLDEPRNAKPGLDTDMAAIDKH